MKFIRYRKGRHATNLFIGGLNNKLEIFITDRCVRLMLGRHVWHWGKAWRQE